MTRRGQLDPTSARPYVFDAVGAGRVAALRSGGAAQAHVLLIPGYTGSKEDFVPLLDPLTEAGFGVTAIDLPGQYESPGWDDPSAYTPERLAQTVLAVAGRLAERRPVHLVGHSFGGLVARAAVIAEPARFADVTLMSSGPAAIVGARRQRLTDLEPLLALDGLAGVYAAMQDAYASDPGYTAPPPELDEFLRRRFLAGSPAMLKGMGDALRDEPDRVAELAATGRPVLVAFGVDDDAWPPAVQREMARRLGARTAEIPAAAHSPAVENTAATARALIGFWPEQHSGPR